jgi:hypothetical protein
VIEFTAEAVLKGKQPAMLERVDPGPVARVQMAPEKMWERPDAGCVKLNVDRNFLRTERNCGSRYDQARFRWRDHLLRVSLSAILQHGTRSGDMHGKHCSCYVMESGVTVRTWSGW